MTNFTGWLTPGFTQNAPFSGNEQVNLDTELSQGSAPQTAMTSLIALAVALQWLNQALDKTPVSGSRYYVGITIGSQVTLTGIRVKVGGTGGTDLWIAELHDSTGALVATSATAGTTAGTANQWQDLAFTSTYLAVPGTYYIAVQTNGTTAKIATYGSPDLPLVDGSATGSFGTGASITPPTTYTANLGPIAMVY